MKFKQQQFGNAMHGITRNIQDNMENIGITDETIKKAGAIAIPIIASAAMSGRGGVFSTKVS